MTQVGQKRMLNTGRVSPPPTQRPGLHKISFGSVRAGPLNWAESKPILHREVLLEEFDPD